MTDRTMNEHIANCYKCPRQCPLTDVQCGRGEQFLEELQRKKENVDGPREPVEKRSGNESENGRTEGSRSQGQAEGSHSQGHAEGFHGQGRAEGTPGQGHAEGPRSQGRSKSPRSQGPHGHGRAEGRGPMGPRAREGFGGRPGLWERLDGEDELSMLLGKCGHFLYHRPAGGRGQGRILEILAGRDMVTQKELQETLGIQPGSASEILSKLEARGLVGRQRDEQDKRKVVLRITEAGKAGAQACSDEKKGRNLYAGLNGEEQEHLKELLRKLLNSWYLQE